MNKPKKVLRKPRGGAASLRGAKRHAWPSPKAPEPAIPVIDASSPLRDERGITPAQAKLASKVATEVLEHGKWGAITQARTVLCKDERVASKIKYNQKVKQAVSEYIYKALKSEDITRQRVADELGRIAFFDPARMFGSDGRLLTIPEMDEDTRRCIQGFDIEQRTEKHEDGEEEVYYVMKPRMYNKNQALDILTRLKELPGDLPGGANGSMAAVPVFQVNFVSATVINTP